MHGFMAWLRRRPNIDIQANYRLAHTVILIVVAIVVLWSTIAKSADDPVALKQLNPQAISHGFELYDRKKWSKAFKSLLPLAEAGHPRAMLLVGEMMLHGRGVVSDLEAGLVWLERAGEKGHARDANYVAGRYLGMWRQDWARAVPYVELAANLDHPEAQAMLADMYAIGRGIPRDTEKAEIWARRAASQTGNAWVVYRAARSYLDGEKRDHVEAVKSLIRASKMGLAIAQSDLGTLYLEGELVPFNLENAQYWLVQAAERGVPVANMRLAEIYARLGQPRNAISCWIDAWKGARLTENQALLIEVYKWYTVLGIAGHISGGKLNIDDIDQSPPGVCRGKPMEIFDILVSQYFEDVESTSRRSRW